MKPIFNGIHAKFDMVINKAIQILFTPVGDITSTNVQDAIEELDTEKQKKITYDTDYKSILIND